MGRCFDKSYHSIFFLYPEHTFVAIDQGRIVGGMNADVYSAKVRIGYLGWLYVAPDYRGSGVGRLLLDAVLDYLEDEVDEICGCIEGDNPSSFKNLANRDGFSIMSLYEQFHRFGFKAFRVWKRASRFFDMGYFMWHKSTGDGRKKKALSPSIERQAASFLLTVLFNTLLFSLLLLRKGMLSIDYALIPFFVLSVRTAASASMMVLCGTKPIFLAWDTSWFSSLLSLALPFYFPSPGGVYPEGKEWNIRDKKAVLGKTGLAVFAAEALMLLLLPKTRLFILLLFIADSMCCFYPFCGFNASRIRRYPGRLYPLIFSIALALVLLVFFP